MGTALQHNFEIQGNYNLSRHAWERMINRGLSPMVIRHVINFGRVTYIRGAKIYAIGRKEVERFEHDGVDLEEAEGIQVVCSHNGVIITAYRNHDFRGLRPRRRRSRRWSR